MISDLIAKHGKGANDAIIYFEKFKLVESRWEVNNDTGRPEKGYRTFYNAFQISTSLTFDEAQELLTVVLMPEKEFNNFESEIVEMIGSEGTFANDISKKLNISSLVFIQCMNRSPIVRYCALPLGCQSPNIFPWVQFNPRIKI